MTIVELPSASAALDVLSNVAGRGWRPLSDLLLALPPEPEMMPSAAPNNDGLPTFRWLVDPTPTVWQPSAHDRRCRARATVLACRAASAGIAPGGDIYRLYQELETGVRRPGRERAVRAVAATMVSQYLGLVGAGPGAPRFGQVAKGGALDCWAVRNGRLVDPSHLRLDAQLDGLCWVSTGMTLTGGPSGRPVMRTAWTLDVLSVAKRRGQLISDCAAGRVQRAVRLAATEGVVEADAVALRVFAPGMSRPRLAFEAISAMEQQRRFSHVAGELAPTSSVDAVAS
jgi:hypothetical protein